jgi:hypothetical protein
MTWFAFQGLNSGQAIDLAGAQEKIAVSEGFHGYATQAAAQAAPNSVNLLQRAAADGFIADYKAAVAGQEQPGGKNAGNPLAGSAEADASAAANATGASSLLGIAQNAYKILDSKGTYLRIAKVVVGSFMIIVGLAKITGADKAVETAAKAVAK